MALSDYLQGEDWQRLLPQIGYLMALAFTKTKNPNLGMQALQGWMGGEQAALGREQEKRKTQHEEMLLQSQLQRAKSEDERLAIAQKLEALREQTEARKAQTEQLNALKGAMPISSQLEPTSLEKTYEPGAMLGMGEGTVPAGEQAQPPGQKLVQNYPSQFGGISMDAIKNILPLLQEQLKANQVTRTPVQPGQPIMEQRPGGAPPTFTTAPGEAEIKNQTPEMLTAKALKEELGREPTATEIKARILAEGKGYDTPEEAFKVAQQMVQAAGKDAGLVPSYDLTPQNKYVPKVQPNITVRIPPFQQGQNLPPGIVFNRKSGKYSDTTTGKDFDREELINLYGQNAAINADKMALGELTKREQLIKVFTNRIDANVPIVLDAVKDVKNSNVRLYNQAINQGKQYLLGSGKWTALQTAMRSLSNEIQRVETGQLGIGGQGEEERKVWAKFHDPNMSFKDIEEVTKMLQKLSGTAVSVIEKQRQDLINRIPTEGKGYGEEPLTQTPTKKKYQILEVR